MRIVSFSADGVREAAQRGFYAWLCRQDADFVCVQDLRCSEYDLRDEVYFPSGYNAYFFDDVGGKDNGVAIYCRELPKAIMTGLGFADFDMQGRYIQADFARLSVGCLLAPSASQGDDAEQDSKNRFFELLGGHLQKVRNKRRDFIICGDWQIAPAGADVQDPDACAGHSGFLSAEQEWMRTLLANGYVDAFREVSADTDEFTFWPEAPGRGGWRTNLQIVSENLQDAIEHAAIYTGQSFSRHAPVIIDYDIEL